MRGTLGEVQHNERYYQRLADESCVAILHRPPCRHVIRSCAWRSVSFFLISVSGSCESHFGEMKFVSSRNSLCHPVETSRHAVLLVHAVVWFELSPYTKDEMGSFRFSLEGIRSRKGESDSWLSY